MAAQALLKAQEAIRRCWNQLARNVDQTLSADGAVRSLRSRVSLIWNGLDIPCSLGSLPESAALACAIEDAATSNQWWIYGHSQISVTGLFFPSLLDKAFQPPHSRGSFFLLTFLRKIGYNRVIANKGERL